MTFIELTPDISGTRDVPAISAQKGIPFLAFRNDADTITEADGDLALVQVNQEGRLKVAAKPAAYPTVSGNIIANGGTVVADVARASNLMVHVKGGGTAGAGGNFTFEGSLDSTNGTDGTWFGIQAVRTNANTIEGATGVLALAINTGLTYGWELSVNGLNFVRVRATAFTSGIYSWILQRAPYATEPVPAMQTHPVTGSGNFAVTMAASATAAPAKAEDSPHASGDVGTFVLGVRNDNLASADYGANGDYGPLSTDARGAVYVRERPSISATLTNITASTSNQTLAAANAARRGVAVYNDSVTATLYIKYGTTASATSFTVRLAPGDYYESPFGYTGQVDGVWTAADGAARVTEIS